MKTDLYDFLMFKVCVGSIEELHKLSGVLLTDLHRYFTKMFNVLTVALPILSSIADRNIFGGQP